MVRHHGRDGANEDLGVGFSLPLAIVHTGRVGGVSALGGGDVLADILGDDLVAGHLNVVALGHRLGHAALALHLLKLSLTLGSVVGDIGNGVGERVAGVEEGVRLRGRNSRGKAGEEENLVGEQELRLN